MTEKLVLELANGYQHEFSSHYELAKYILFGHEKEGVPIYSAPRLRVDKSVEKLIAIKRIIMQRRQAVMGLLMYVPQDDDCPF